MQRGSDRLNVHRDDQMKHELQGLLRSGHPTRTEEWTDPEPPAEDDPEVYRGAMVAGTGGRPAPESVRLELYRSLTRHDFPAAPRELAGVLRRKNAPETLVERVSRLPRSARYGSLLALAEAVTGGE
ncbi:DUF2795 domain-containing protein [Streptomyces sp. NPDC001980]|uniref:DUF2795 domain-containing protein n=1 Tax=Streptomyces sp. NPDC001980 TaxID=3157126 RepID=UPI0033347CDA